MDYFHVSQNIFNYTHNHLWVHGYLAVDLFFMLSGFVLGYAYDAERWKKLTTLQFIKLRIHRLHPMVLLSILLGLVGFIYFGCSTWDGKPVPASHLTLTVLGHVFMVPSLPGWITDISGDGAAFPLNGPLWTLWFEYLGSLLFALLLRRLSTRWLALLAALLALPLAYLGYNPVSYQFGLGLGPSFEPYGFTVGLVRMLFAFTVGLLLARVYEPRRVKGAFWISVALLLQVLSMPGLEPLGQQRYNGIYDVACIILIFPLIVWIGASTTTRGGTTAAFCAFLGAISFPLYAIHYPIVDFFAQFIFWRKIPAHDALPLALVLISALIILAWLLYKYYETPVRRLLRKK